MEKELSGKEQNEKYYQINVILISLGVVASLKEHDKLIWDLRGCPNIQEPGYFTPIKRKFQCETRNSSLINLNRLIYDGLVSIQSDEVDENNKSRIRSKLLDANKGVNILMTTYRGDEKMIQSLSVLSHDIMNMETSSSSQFYTEEF
jgi:hypothetical protein